MDKMKDALINALQTLVIIPLMITVLASILAFAAISVVVMPFLMLGKYVKLCWMTRKNSKLWGSK